MESSKNFSETKYRKFLAFFTAAFSGVFVLSVYWVYQIFYFPSRIAALTRDSSASREAGANVFDFDEANTGFVQTMANAFDSILTERINYASGFDLMLFFFKPYIVAIYIVVGICLVICLLSALNMLMRGGQDLRTLGQGMAAVLIKGFGFLFSPAYSLAALVSGSNPNRRGREILGTVFLLGFVASLLLMFLEVGQRSSLDLENEPFVVRVDDSNRVAGFVPLSQITTVKQVISLVKEYQSYTTLSQEEIDRRTSTQKKMSELLEHSGLSSSKEDPLKGLKERIEKGDGPLVFYGLFKTTFDLASGEIDVPKGANVIYKDIEGSPFEKEGLQTISIGVARTDRGFKSCEFSGTWIRLYTEKKEGGLDRIIDLVNEADSLPKEKKAEIVSSLEKNFAVRLHYYGLDSGPVFSLSGTSTLPLKPANYDACKQPPQFKNIEVMLTKLDNFYTAKN